MKSVGWLLLCLLSFFPSVKTVSTDNSILWTEDYKLKWEDFAGQPPADQTWGEQSETKTRIEASAKIVKSKIVYTVCCYFDKEKSWSVNKTSAKLLEHEQLHFDIAEVYARSLRKKLKEMTGVTRDNLQQKLKDQYHEIFEACIAYQKKYDEQSENSRNPANQAIWKDRIDQALSNTSAYASVGITVNM